MNQRAIKTSRSLRRQKVALVGGGKGGCSLLQMLLIMPGVIIRQVFDINPDAPAMRLARESGIACSDDPDFLELAGNEDIDIILEVTGKSTVFEKLNGLKHAHTSLIGASGSRFMFDLVDILNEARCDLETHQDALEKEISERTEALRVANQKLQQQIEDYRQLNENLQRVNDQKTSYLLRSTHQLKAPFAAIQSFVDVILEGFTGEIPDKTAKVMVKIKERCQLLSHSIKEMLELANLKSVVVSNVRMAHHPLGDIIRTVIDQCRPVADGRNIRLETAFEVANDEVMCNGEQLKILFSVLLENAISYSHGGGSVDISIRKSEQDVVASVTDHGIGMSAETQNRIFEEFYRSNQAAAHDPSGTGLGLTIAERISSLHGFTLTVTSELGQGTTFALLIPEHLCQDRREP